MLAFLYLGGFKMAEYPVRRNPKTIIVVVTIITILIVATYGILSFWKPRFVVYTYSSFMDWGDEGAEVVLERAFAPFEEQYGIDIDFVVLEADANFIVSRLNAEASNPVADVVIGIDNILILQEAARNVLQPYESPSLALINDTLVNALDPDHYLTPFDFGLVTLIYSMNTINTTTHPQLDNLTLADLTTTELASALVTEDPHLSSPGLAFLLSQIAIYEKILDEDWTNWWEAVEGNIDVEEGWTEAWSSWSSDPTKHLLVSYGTDPAYSANYLGTAPDTAIAPFHYQDTDWAWMQVEGVGLVKNGPNPDLGKAFIDYCLNATVQSEIALNQWMFPVRTDLILPAVFDYAIHPNEVSILNTLLNNTEIADNLQSWLDEYDTVMTPG
ncbi:thiamine ABC transporter substrate-binding protein [Candidatus Thorarchaeota archaeon]|nr:MAG: thiamine ABC transporter substrate-binding protein [Candidatus Thorarchaeota archaeon]